MKPKAKRQIANDINVLINFDSYGAKCRYCGSQFCADIPEDVVEHERIHLLFEKAEHHLGFLPAGNEIREKNKKRAYGDLRANKSPAENVDAALRLIRGWFDRSLDVAIRGGYWRKHPKFESYIAMVDYSERIMSAETMLAIRGTYGRLPGHIAKGESYWYLPSDCS